jgi:type II secretory pathway component PulK
MKIAQCNARQRGSAILMLLGILALLFVVAAANHGSLRKLRRELKLVEQQQLKRWAATRAVATNAPGELRP